MVQHDVDVDGQTGAVGLPDEPPQLIAIAIEGAIESESIEHVAADRLPAFADRRQPEAPYFESPMRRRLIGSQMSSRWDNCRIGPAVDAPPTTGNPNAIASRHGDMKRQRARLCCMTIAVPAVTRPDRALHPASGTIPCSWSYGSAS